MASKLVTTPIPGARAFTQKTPAAVLSQAAQLLLLGIYLRGDDAAFQARAKLAKTRNGARAIPELDRAKIKVPRVRAKGQRFSRRDIQAGHKALYQLKVEGPQNRHHRIRTLAKGFYAKPHPRTAAQLLEGCLNHPAELVRVAAASTYFDLTTDYKDLVQILVRGTRNKDPLIAEVAATALAHAAPENPRLRQMTAPTRSRTQRGTARTSLLVHGTFAQTQAWWQPGGSFHNYLLTSVRKDLYTAPDRFQWNGGYWDKDRNLAAKDLASWLTSHKARGASLFAHSHGGNIAMLTSHTPSLKIDELVLLACPVHVPKYLPNFSSVKKIVSIRVHLDLVILADRGGQRFSHPKIKENVLPVWFSHGASHDENVWRKYNVPSML